MGINLKSGEKSSMPGILLLFSLVLVFQLSIVKYTLDLGGPATIVNSLMLFGFSIIALRNIISQSFFPGVWGFYLFPGALVYTGYLLNIGMNAMANTQVASSLGLLIPWAAYLAVPFFIGNVSDTEIIWRFFYRSMILITAMGLLEYLLVFSGMVPLRTIETPLGIFVSGRLSILHMLEDGTAYSRFYAIFPEPGTFAMYLLPVLMYALVYKKYMGLLLFATALFLTESLGGFISLILLVLLYVFIRVRNSRFSLGVTVIPVLILAVGLVGYVSTGLSEAYRSKNISAEVREDNATNVIEKFPALILKYPFGMTLAEGSQSNIVNDDYFGSNFALGNALVLGGFFSLIGYFMVLGSCLAVSLASLTKRISGFDQQVVFPSLLALLPFIFQRTTVMDSATYAFLFAPSVIRSLQRKPGQCGSPEIVKNLMVENASGAVTE